MSKYKPQQRRITFIFGKVESGQYPNARTLAEEYEVSERTIQADLEYMREELGIPMAYDTKKKGYYLTEPSYKLPWIDITESDLFAICIADQALAQYRGAPVYEKLSGVFEKIKESLPEEIQVHTSWIGTHYSFINNHHTDIDPSVWEKVSTSLNNRKSLNIMYRKPSAGLSEKRKVHPYHIVNYAGEWYLVAWCTERNAVRRFAISRIKTTEILQDTYEIKGGFSFEEYIKNDFGIISEGKPFTVKIRFTKNHAPYIEERKWHIEQKLKKENDGSLVLEFPATSLIEIKRWILSWGGEAQVLEPGELIDAVKVELETMTKNYSLLKHSSPDRENYTLPDI